MCQVSHRLNQRKQTRVNVAFRYNRLGKMANAELVAMMQDDDHARELDWLERAMELFAKYASLPYSAHITRVHRIAF